MMSRLPIWSVWLIVVVAAVAIRGIALWAGAPRLDEDPDGYRMIGRNVAEHGIYGRSLAEGGVRPTAFRPPLYPLVLAALAPVSNTAVGLLHLALGAATVVGTFGLASLWRLGPPRWLAAGLVALDPILIHQSTLVMTETMATFLSVACLALWTCWDRQRHPLWAAAAGAVFGLAVLCRPTFLVWAMLLVPVLVWQRIRREREHRSFADGLSIAVFCGTLVVVLAPWMIRNARVMDRATATTTHGGYTLLLANNDAFYRHLRSSSWRQVWDSDELDLPLASDPHIERSRDPASEVRNDQVFYQRARTTIRQNPGTFLAASLLRVTRLWSPLPHSIASYESGQESWRRRAIRYAVAVWYTIWMLAAVGGLARLWMAPSAAAPSAAASVAAPSAAASVAAGEDGPATKSRRLSQTHWMAALTLCVAVTAVHAVYWSNMRMRAPLVPVVALLAAAAVQPRGDRRK